MFNHPYGLGAVAAALRMEASPLSLLMHMDGTEGSTVFTDSSPYNHSITNVGSVSVDTADKKFGTGSALFGAVAGKRLVIPHHSAFQLNGNVPFTIEAQVKLDAYTTVGGANECLIAAKWATASQQSWFMGVNTGGYFVFYRKYTGGLLDFGHASSVPIGLSDYRHLAASYDGTTLRMFVAGIKRYESVVALNIFESTAPLLIGGFDDGNNVVNGRVDELRIIKGSAEYLDDFTPPTAPFSYP